MLLCKSKLVGPLPMEKTLKKTHREGAERDALFPAYTLPGVSGEQPRRKLQGGRRWNRNGVRLQWTVRGAGRDSSGYRHLTPGETEALKQSRASNPCLLQVLPRTGCAASHESLPPSWPLSVSSQNHGTRGEAKGRRGIPGGCLLNLTWKATGPLRERGRDWETQEMATERDGDRWRDREKETDLYTEGRETDRELWRRLKEKGTKERVKKTIQKGDVKVHLSYPHIHW